MAKYSLDLFDEIVEEMFKEKRTLMEMMAELDVDEGSIMDAQDRIAKKRTKFTGSKIEGGDAKAEGAKSGDK